MTVLFLTLVDIVSIGNHGIYEDLLREIARHGHQIYIISPTERRYGQSTHIVREDKATILKVRTLNTQKTNLIEKGISTVLLELLLIHAIRRHFKDIRFDLILYSTPPITFARVVSYVRNRSGAKTYLLLKDIFPQNAVDLGMMREGSVIHRYFLAKEKKLYAVSDRIGCMSPANANYLLKHNPEIRPERVEICPNSIDPQPISLTVDEREIFRRKYGLPLDRKVFVYGGNLGKPQDVPFIIRCLKACSGIDAVFFFIVGGGTDYSELETYVNIEKPTHVKLLPSLPKEEYDRMIAACDVGLIFLDHRFTIPNFPSRLLNYMQAGLPILACTDRNTDIGKIIQCKKFGWWCESNNSETFGRMVKEASTSDLAMMGKRGLAYLEAAYTTEETYGKIFGIDG